MAKLTQERVLKALSTVMDPELNKDLVTLGMIRDMLIEENNVRFSLVLTTSACPLKKEIEASARAAVEAIEEIGTVIIDMGADVPQAKGLPDKQSIPGIKNIVAVASGKGGVGKSTVAVNLALALAKEGASVGILDADVFGPSIPMMMGIHEQPQATEDERIIPLESNGIKIMSVGFMLDEETPLIWRGPLVMQLVKQFLMGVEWGELDYLVIDLPPGTGDVQLTLVQTVPVTGVVIVTTPQDIALLDARRAIKMFTEVKVPIIGIAENMSYFVCPHCSEKTEIFSHGGAEKTSKRYDVPLLGHIPLDPAIREGGDTGSPIVIADPDSAQSVSIIEMARQVAARISVFDLKDEQHRPETV